MVASWWMSIPPPPWCRCLFGWLAGRYGSPPAEKWHESSAVVVEAPGGVYVAGPRWVMVSVLRQGA
jgi:hypothetical protein